MQHTSSALSRRLFTALCALLAASTLFAAGCEKNSDDKAAAKTAEKTGEESGKTGEEEAAMTDETTGEEAGTADEEAAAGEAAPEPVAEEPPAPAKLLPTTIDPAVAIPAEALQEAVAAWNGKEIVVGGHLWLFMGDSDTLRPSFELAATPDAGKEDKLLKCTLEGDAPAEPIKRTDPLVIKGTFKEASTMWKAVILEKCQVVSTDVPFDATAEANPWQLGDAPIPVKALSEATFGWIGKEVMVQGRYWGSTYSSASDRVRHDLAGPDGKKAVGCHQAGDVKAPESVVADREGVIMKGTIAELRGDSVYLENCTWENRQ